MMCFADWLRRTGIGTMRWLVPEDARGDYILRSATTDIIRSERPAWREDARTGCGGQGTAGFSARRNLFVAGSSVFPTSGEANPTLTAVALAMRLAEHIAHRGTDGRCQ